MTVRPLLQRPFNLFVDLRTATALLLHQEPFFVGPKLACFALVCGQAKLVQPIDFGITARIAFDTQSILSRRRRLFDEAVAGTNRSTRAERLVDHADPLRRIGGSHRGKTRLRYTSLMTGFCFGK